MGLEQVQPGEHPDWEQHEECGRGHGHRTELRGGLPEGPADGRRIRAGF